VNDRRILYIAPGPPYPLTNGQALRHFHFLRAYSEIGRVRLAFLYRSEAQREVVRALAPYCESVHPIPAPLASRFAHAGLWRRRLDTMTSLTPNIAAACANPEMASLVSKLAPAADLIHVAKLWMAPNVGSTLGRGHSRPVVLDLDDVETVVKWRALRTYPPARWRRRVFESYDLLRLWRYQHQAIKRFDRVFVCSGQDRDWLGQPNVEVIPNGAVIPRQPLPDGSDGRTLLCVTSMHWQPNVDGVLFFARDVLPLIQREVPDVRLLVVGSGAPPDVQRLHDGRRIFVFSDVPALEPYYRQATAAVVSLRVGGGTRLRMLEAFALGRPVVSTSVGCEGIDVVNGQHLLVADGPKTFAAACVAILRDPQLGARLAGRARRLVEDKYSWQSIEEQIRMISLHLLRGPRAA
jgi:glycosyltransferase involved in cell wall biosynthesis